MSTDVVVHQAGELSEKMEWARTLSVANLLPKAFQGNPGNLLFAVEYADALGISRINAITSIHVIEGKPSASADLIAALVRRAGHILRVHGTDASCCAQLIRSDDPEFTYEANWNMNKAKAAGLLGKAVWKNYPAAMLRSRAITEVARMGASEALLGLIYTPEELGADVDQTGAPVRYTATVEQPKSAADRMRALVEPEPEPEDVHQMTDGVLPKGWDEPPMTKAQRGRIFAQFAEMGVTDDQLMRDYMTNVLERPVTEGEQGRASLTLVEADRIIEAQKVELQPEVAS